MNGGTVSIAPRSIVMLVRVHLADTHGQIDFVTREQTPYEDRGRINSIGSPATDITNTFLDIVLLYWKRYIEDVNHPAYVNNNGRPAHFLG